MAQERLQKKALRLTRDGEEERRGTYIRMETVAISRGYTERTKMTPMMYQITPFVVFYVNKGNAVSR